MSASLTTQSDYAAFLASQAPRAQAMGMVPLAKPDHMFDYQKACTEFCLKQGRAAIFLNTGLGKTRIELEFCHQATIETGFPSLILAPLAVAGQIARQGADLGYPIRVVRDQSEVSAGINVCNYDRLDKLDPTEFGCVALDESSILKSLHGAMRKSLTEAFRDTPFRLCATATPAPNDHMELGQHAEFLGILSSMEMLARWFVNDTSTLLCLFCLFIMPVLIAALTYRWRGGVAWRTANRSSAGLLPPADEPVARVLVLTARTVSWRGVLAHHAGSC